MLRSESSLPLTEIYHDHYFACCFRKAMMAAKEGVYCGPLRLLAMEIYDECNASGTFCNLYTGQYPPTRQQTIRFAGLRPSEADCVPGCRLCPM